MDKKDIQQRLANAREVVAVGSRNLADRSFLRSLGLRALPAVAGIALGTALGVSSFSDTGILSSQEQQATASVVAKIWQPGGSELAPTGGNVWQPAKDAASSAYNLVLTLPGELKPVVVAVSPQMYDAFCQKAAAADLRSGFTGPGQKHQGGCGATFSKEDPNPERIALEEIQISYTRNKLDDSVQVTQMSVGQKAATSFAERISLRRELSQQPKELKARSPQA